MKKRKASYAIMDDATLERCAYVLGPQSAAARALADARKQREDGNDAVVISGGQMLLVCSRWFAEMAASQ